MKTLTCLLPLSLFAISACQGGVSPEQKQANAACANASLQSGCYQLVHGALEAQAEERQANAGNGAGVGNQQHSYIDDFETRPVIIENPIAPKTTDSQPRDVPPNEEN